MNITEFTTTQLNQIIAIKEQIEALQGQIESDHPEKGKVKQPQSWILGDPREVEFPGTGKLALRDIANVIHSMPSISAETKAKEWVQLIRAKGFYKKND